MRIVAVNRKEERPTLAQDIEVVRGLREDHRGEPVSASVSCSFTLAKYWHLALMAGMLPLRRAWATLSLGYVHAGL